MKFFVRNQTSVNGNSDKKCASYSMVRKKTSKKKKIN